MVYFGGYHIIELLDDQVENPLTAGSTPTAASPFSDE